MPPKKSQPPQVEQTAIGDGNVQIAGENNTVTVNQTFIQKISNFIVGDTEAQRAMRNRRAMLELVNNTWIKGVLEKSLYNEVLIELGMEERPGAVDHPWEMQIQMPNQINRILPAGTSMMQVFDEMGGAMLILGEPGSGKTTMLLELARDCIVRAQDDDTRPIPVVFSLSSWDGKHSIDDWLTSELNTKYNVPKKTAQNWVRNDDLQLLLDGLDEVKLENREPCVKSINEFRQKHGLTVPIAICSRIADYEMLKTKLNLTGAVYLQPLIPQQIDAYFKQIGPDLERVHHVLQNDETLQELVKQPLMLSVITLAYSSRLADALTYQQNMTLESRRKYLFDTYIQQMFERVARIKNQTYTPERTKHWLAWLAQKMIENSAVPCFIENLQPKWLNQKKRGMYRLIIGMISGSIGGLILGIFGGITVGLSGWLIFGLIGGLFAGRSGIKTVDNLTWDYEPGTKGVIFGFVCGFGVGVIIGMGNMSGGCIIGPIGGLIGGLISGFRMKPVSQTTIPGQRILLSTRSSVVALVTIGFIVALIIWLFILLTGWFTLGVAVVASEDVIDELDTGFGLIDLMSFALRGGLIGGLISGLISGLNFGGFAVIQHFTLRFVLAKNEFLPWNLIPFLDYCVDRIFLRRVGGGYIFVHRLLMEHFADMYTANESIMKT